MVREERAAALPPEIAFLEAAGLPRAALEEAAARARAEGVDAARALLAHGLAQEEAVYRALAAAIGAPFLAAPRLAPGARFPEAIRAGLAPLAARGPGLGYVAAPEGPALAALAARRRAPEGLAVTTPSALAAAVFRARGVEIARAAADGLAERTPERSFKGGASPRQAFAIGFCCAGGIAALATLPGAVALAAAAGGLVFLAMACLRLATCLEPAPVSTRAPHPRAPDAELPVYTVVVALYREANVVGALCAALARLDYPLGKLDVKLVVEDDDDATRDAILALRLPPCFTVVSVPDGAPRTKPRALNVALPLARGALLVVYDAEDRPDPAQLRLAADAFARAGPEVACLQARLAIHNSGGFLRRLFAIEYAALFDVVNPGLVRFGLPIPLGGTSNHFRVAALERVGGWDAWCVTEDADLGVRLAALGLCVEDLPSTTWEEAPARLSVWLRQRARWMKGYMQVLVTYTRSPRRSLAALGPARAAAALLLIGGTTASALLYPLTILVGAAILLDAPVPGLDLAAVRSDPLALVGGALGLVTFASGFATMAAPAVVALKRRRRYDLLPFVALLPAYYALVSLAAWRGLVELLRSPSHWHKTEHGLPQPPSRLAGVARRLRLVGRRA